jgi:signal transduction histidine kinase
MTADVELIDKGVLAFTIESRILRELGERLVKQPEVALLELIKNAYDADAPLCTVTTNDRMIIVQDTGDGMTLNQFKQGWMRIGTSAKEAKRFSPRYSRPITGEKGIGRFAVRFLGRSLNLVTVADDPEQGGLTRLTADFDWPKIDQIEDLSSVQVPFTVVKVDPATPKGTTLTVGDLRPGVPEINLNRVRTGSVGVLTPLRTLLEDAPLSKAPASKKDDEQDPGFVLKFKPIEPEDRTQGDVAAEILDAYALRARATLDGKRLRLSVFKQGQAEPYLEIAEAFENQIGQAYLDIRFLPYRKGVFRGLGVDGHTARRWIVDNSGIAVFDRAFRVSPYGEAADDWLFLSADSARNSRDPRSSIAQKHFAMDPAVRASTSENWMLRLPQPSQVVGVVQVEGRRSADQTSSEGLVASADREGFVDNVAFQQLRNLVRGAVEAIAFADRAIQREEEEKVRQERIVTIRTETRSAIEAIESNAAIPSRDKSRIVSALVETERLASQQDESARERERQLEVMSLLGVVAGFMTHEFGVAISELKETHRALLALAKTDNQFADTAKAFEVHIAKLDEFVTYSQGYIHGSRNMPAKPYKVRPRLNRIAKIFGAYAETRGIDLEIDVEPDLIAPLVPAALYDGIALNLYTNGLKAVTAKAGSDPRRIAFRAWNEGRFHMLEVADTGIGIPSVLHQRVFDPLFTTTASSKDPLGSGMGLGLALVRRGAQAFGGAANVVDPPAGFATCVQIRLPLETGTPA